MELYNLKFPKDQYYTKQQYGIDLNNSDIIKVNALWIADDNTWTSEGIFFPTTKTNSDKTTTISWDSFYLKNGNAYLAKQARIGPNGQSAGLNKIVSLLTAKEKIDDNTDLNNLQQDGQYFAGGGNSGLSHKPKNIDAFSLRVYQTAGSYKCQELTAANNLAKHQKYIRFYEDNEKQEKVWTDWELDTPFYQNYFHPEEYLKFNKIANRITLGSLTYSSDSKNNALVTLSTLANWNGKYHDNHTSHLQYCDKGRFGTIVIKNIEDYLPLSGGTLTGPLIVAKINKISFQELANINFGENAKTNFTLDPFKLNQVKNSDGTLSHWDTVLKVFRTGDRVASAPTSPEYLCDGYSSAMLFGYGDTKVFFSARYDTPLFKVAGASRDKVNWYFGISGTSGKTYNLDNFLRADKVGAYYGMAVPGGGTDSWIRTTTLGLIPYQSGGSKAGHGSLGTETWYFSKAYIDNVYSSTLHILGSATDDMTYNSSNPKITFSISDKSQPVSLIYTNYDSYRAPAGLKVVGDTTDGSVSSPAWFEVEGALISDSIETNQISTDYLSSRYMNHNIAAFGNYFTEFITTKRSGKVTSFSKEQVPDELRLFDRKWSTYINIFKKSSSQDYVKKYEWVWNVSKWDGVRAIRLFFRYADNPTDIKLSLFTKVKGEWYKFKEILSLNEFTSYRLSAETCLIEFPKLSVYPNSEGQLKLVLENDTGSADGVYLQEIELLSFRVDGGKAYPEFNYPYSWDQDKNIWAPVSIGSPKISITNASKLEGTSSKILVLNDKNEISYQEPSGIRETLCVVYGNGPHGVNNSSDANNIWRSGFYNLLDSLNTPEADSTTHKTDGWTWLINSAHNSNSDPEIRDYRYGLQIAGMNSSKQLYFRCTNTLGEGTWQKIYHTGFKPTLKEIGVYSGTSLPQSTEGYKEGDLFCVFV